MTQWTRTQAPNARDIMTPKPLTVAPDTSIPVAIHKILSQRQSEIPIVDESGKYWGMFSEKCCIRVLASINNLPDSHNTKPLVASDVMVPRQRLLTLTPQDNVFDAMSVLLANGFSSAPVISATGTFQGVFSEKTCLGFIIEAAYSGIPSGQVGQFVDEDGNRLIDPDLDIRKIAEIFVETAFGRLPVMRGENLVGQISRRDLLNSNKTLVSIIRCHLDEPNTERGARMPIAETHRATLGTLSEHNVSTFADLESCTIDSELDLFSIAQSFFESPFRRFAVLEEGKLIGQLTRSDVLRHAIALLRT